MQSSVPVSSKSFSSLLRRTQIEIAIVILIASVAIFFRFFRLAEVPPGLNSDEATNFFHMLGLLHGEFRISFGPDAREPFFFYLSLVPVTLLGFPFFVMRLTAGIIGVIAVLFVYALARNLFRSTLIAALASFFAAISVWHIFWSRYGLRAVLCGLFVLFAMWWFWRAVNSLRWRDFAFAGIYTGLASYTYLSARMLPLAFVVLTLFAIMLNRRQSVRYLQGFVLTGTIAAAVFVPLALYYLTNIQDFISHSANLSIFDPRVSQGNVPLALWNNVVTVAGMYLVRGDAQAYRNIPERPVFDPLLGTFFIIGIIVLGVGLLSRRSTNQERLRAAFLGVWVIVFALPSILSDDPPSFVRTLASMPAVMMLAAWGISTVWDFMRGNVLRRVAVLGLGLLLIVEAGFSYRDYFDRFAPSGVAFYAFDGHIVETGKWVNQNAAAAQTFIAPLWYQQPTFRFMTRNTPLKSFESRDTVVLPARGNGKDALFVFPQEQEKKAERLGERLGALATREVLPGAFGVNYAVAYRIPAKNLPDAHDPLDAMAKGGDFVKPQKSLRAVWGDQFELLGYSLDALDAPKRNLEVTLFLRALKPMTTDYTFSIKARDVKDRVWGQEDKWAGDNSYATTAWSPGDVIIEKFYPGLNGCAPAGDYRLTVEAYDPKTGRVLALSDRDGNVLTIDMTHADASQGNRPEDLEPERSLDVQVAPQMRLLGFTLTPDEARGGDEFSLSLFWRGIGNGTQTRRIAIRLDDARLAEREITLPPDGRGLCVLFDVRVPQDFAPGTHPIFVNDTKLAEIKSVK